MASDELPRDLEAAHPPPHALLIELERRSREDCVPIVSRVTGRFLSTIVTAMQANRILEVGTSYGYSTLWMALAQPSAGKIWTVDSSVARTDVAREYFRRAAEDDYIEAFNTPAVELLENFPHRNLDIAFFVGDETEYVRYLELILPMLKLSGLAIFNDCSSMGEFIGGFLRHPDLNAMVLPFGLGFGARRR